MKFNKKGAIEITATAIVVLIIAIIVLGSVIYFIKFFLGEAKTVLTEQLDQVKSDLLKFMREGGEPLGFSFREELKIKKSETKPVVIAINNNFDNPDGKTVCYKIGIKCLKPFSGISECIVGKGEPPTTVGGWDWDGSAGQKPEERDLWFKDLELLTGWDVENRKSSAEPIDVQITNARSGKYQMEAVLLKSKDKKNCKDAGEDFEEVATKRFRVVID